MTNIDPGSHLEFRQVLGGLAIGVTLAAGAWLLLISGQLGHPHPGNQWVLDAWSHKQGIVEATEPPRLLVAGGSSAMFGIDSQQLEQAFGRATINLGVNAGLGLPAILNQTLSSAKAGDTVVMPLEYPLFSHRGDINQVMNNFYLSQPESLLAAWQLYRESLPLYRWLPLVAHEAFQIVMQTSLARVIQGYRGLPDNFTAQGTYGAHRLDAHGDQTQTSRDQRHSWMAQQVMAETPRRYGAERVADAPGWALLRHLQSRLDDRGACLVVVPPAFLFHPEYRKDPIEEQFFSTLPERAAKHGLVYRGDPWAFMYPAKDMFDTDFHLVDEARQRNTRQLIEVLTAASNTSEPVIECSRPTIETRMTRQPLADQVAALDSHEQATQR